jgi:hypothetical protein
LDFLSFPAAFLSSQNQFSMSVPPPQYDHNVSYQPLAHNQVYIPPSVVVAQPVQQQSKEKTSLSPGTDKYSPFFFALGFGCSCYFGW